MGRYFNFRNKGLILVPSLGIIMVAGALIAVLQVGKAVEESEYWTEHTHEVILETQNVKALLEDIQNGERGYLISGDSTFLKPALASETLASNAIEHLRKLTLDNPYQGPRIDSVARISRTMTRYIGEYGTAGKKFGFEKRAAVLQDYRGKHYLDSLTRILNRIEHVELNLLKQRRAVNQRNIQLFKDVVIFLLGSLGLFVLINLLVILNSLRVKEQTEEHRALIESIVSGSDDAIISKDLSGVITSWNSGAERLFGYSPGEALAKHISMLIPHERLNEEKEIMTSVSRGDRVNPYDTERLRKDGSLVHVSLSVSPIRNRKGKIVGASKIARDITQRKKIEEMSRANLELESKVNAKTAELAEVFERITDGFIMLDKDFRYTYANKRVGEMVGRDPASLIGKYVWAEFPDAARSRTADTFNEAMQEQHYTYNVDYYPPLNLWQENRVYPTSDGLSVFIRDISEQKKAEEKIRQSERIYKTIASSIPGSVISLLDKDLRYFLIEGDMLESLGYSKEMLLGNKVEDVLSAERLAQTLPNLKRVFLGESLTLENSQLGHDTLARYVPLRDEENNVVSAMVVLFDVTPLKNAQRAIANLNLDLEQKIEERTLELQAVNKELEAFSYSVAHDLRTPLRAIDGYSGILKEDFGSQLNAEGKRLLGEIEYNAKKMGTLIDDLLTFSRLGRKEIQKSVSDMNQIARAALQDITLLKNYAGELDIKDLHPVKADTSLMKQVMVNLIGNAIKYSSKNEKPVITVCSEKRDKETVYSVRDNGVGFDMEYASKLFGVFQRLHSDEEFEGTGVGLATVQRIVHRHGGKVWAEGKVGQGATFYFSLPRTDVAG